MVTINRCMIIEKKASVGMYIGRDYPYMYTFLPCHPYFILQLHCFFYTYFNIYDWGSITIYK